MTDDREPGGWPGEEIQGAPPVEFNSNLRERRRMENVSVNRYLYLQCLQLEHMLLQASDLLSLIEALLVTLPRHFSLRAAELWLYDPENKLDQLIVGSERYGWALKLLDDINSMQELYDAEPDVELVQATDSRMFDVLKDAQDVEAALLVPLTDSGRLIGSLHLGAVDMNLQLGEEEAGLIAHVALVISACFTNAVNKEQISQLTVLDPLTEIGNPRGFASDIDREIARARRGERPLTVLFLEIDGHDELYRHYGERRGNFVVRKVSERLSSDLRQTDLMARLELPMFAVLLPDTDEVLAREVAERMRTDIEEFYIDDGRGAVLQVTLSIGIVTWEPLHYPAVDMAMLATQLEGAARSGLQQSRTRGGNRVSHARLSTVIV